MSGTYIWLLSDPTENVAVGHDDNVLFRSAAEVLSHPLSTVVERRLVSCVKALLADPVRRERRKVKALKLWVALKHLLCRASVAGKVVAFLELRQQDHLVQAAKSLNQRSVADLGALQGTLEGRRKDDLCARLQILSQGWQSS